MSRGSESPRQRPLFELKCASTGQILPKIRLDKPVESDPLEETPEQEDENNLNLLSVCNGYCKLGQGGNLSYSYGGSVVTIATSIGGDSAGSDDGVHLHESKWRRLRTPLKIAVFFLVALVSSVIILVGHKSEDTRHLFPLAPRQPRLVPLHEDLRCDYLHVTLRGPIGDQILLASDNSTSEGETLQISICTTKHHKKVNSSRLAGACVGDASNRFVFSIAPSVGHVGETHVRFELGREGLGDPTEVKLPFLKLQSSAHEAIAVELSLVDVGRYGQCEVYVAMVILFFLYFMIVTEVVPRTVAALLSAVISVAALTALKEGPTIEKLIDWVDWETLLLLFGMMIMVAMFAETGFFDYAAVICCRLSKGRMWTLIFVLCSVAAVISAFLDNVTTVLLMTPVIIRVCEALNYDPTPILVAIVLASNIGGAATAIGDPPNVLIVSNTEMQKIGVNFMVFTEHVMGGAVCCYLCGFAVLYVLYRDKDISHTHDPDVQKLQQTIHMWTRYASRIPSVSREERHIKHIIKKQVHQLEKKLAEKKKSAAHAKHDWKQELMHLEDTCKIRDKTLLIKASCVLICVVCTFFLQSTPWIHPKLGFIALLGALLLLILANEEDIDHVVEKVEWSTLIFFASLFILMEALAELHLLDFIGDKTLLLISQFHPSIRLPVAIFMILWVSALSSSFIDNIPFTQAMIPIVLKLGESDETLPILPLVWALALGACLGGNGTLIGASANLVCAATAQQKGYKITFNQFFLTGFPVMLATTLAANVYLFFFHVFPLQWNEN